MTDSRDPSRHLAIGSLGIAGALAAIPTLAQGAGRRRSKENNAHDKDDHHDQASRGHEP